MRRLFINADDFGLTEGVSLGIVEAMAALVLVDFGLRHRVNG